MIKILVATHGSLSKALKDTASMFFGTANEIVTLSLNPEDNPIELKEKVIEKINKIYDDDGIPIFVDLFAGTPCNVSAMIMAEQLDYQIECIAGVNLPLLMEALACKDTMNLQELKDHLMSLASDTVIDLRKYMGF